MYIEGCYLFVCFKYIKSIKQTKNHKHKHFLTQSDNTEPNDYSKDVYDAQREEFYLPLLFVRK